MIKTTYTCDHCKTQVNPERLWVVQLSAMSYQGSAQSFTLQPSCGVAHWCRDCLKASGWFKETPTKPTSFDNPKPATLEKLIVQLVQDTIENINQ